MYSRMDKLEKASARIPKILDKIDKNITDFHEGIISEEQHMKDLSILSHELKRAREYVNLNTTYLREKIADVTGKIKNHL